MGKITESGKSVRKMEDLKVVISRTPYDDESGEISIEKIWDVKWDSISGGVNRKQTGYSLYGYIDYALAAEKVKCSGKHNFGKNSAKICISKSKNRSAEYREGYSVLCKEAGEKPKSDISKYRPAGLPPCTKRILQKLEPMGYIMRKDLREILQLEGYQKTTIRNAIKNLERQSKIVSEGSPNSKKCIIRKMEG